MAIESSVGSLVGGAIGTAIAPGVGTQVGAGLGGALGGVVGAASKDVPEVQREDPAQAARLAEIDKTRRQISAGTDPLTQARVSQIQKAGETTKGQLAKFSGGDVGGTISSLLRAQRNIGQGANQAFTESQQRIPFFENLSTQLGNRIAQRKLELDINAQDQAKAEKAQAQKDTQNAISGTLGSIGGIPGLGGGAGIGGASGAGTPSGAIALGGGGTDALGQFTSASSFPGIATPELGGAFQQGISGTQGISGFGQVLGGGFGG